MYNHTYLEAMKKWTKYIMTSKYKLEPLEHWSQKAIDDNTVIHYVTETKIDEYTITYEIKRRGKQWYPKITADNHITYYPLIGFHSPEDAYTAILKRCKMI